jgi:transposase-like protein
MGRGAKYRNFTEAYRELAVRRLREADNVAELCWELGISRQLLYQWRDKVDRAAKGSPHRSVKCAIVAQLSNLHISNIKNPAQFCR